MEFIYKNEKNIGIIKEKKKFIVRGQEGFGIDFIGGSN